MTLIPVTSTSAEPACSEKLGASRWIEEECSALIGPASSIGSPITFMMRPRQAGPTGTVMGLPVSTTSWPRTRPSVVSMAMARTAFSPRCWATSNTRRTGLPVLASVLVVSSAFRMAGSSPSNSTSTTAPMTWLRRPLEVVLLMAFSFSSVWAVRLSPHARKFLNGGGAGDDFDQFRRDLGLTGAVHLDGEGVDQVARIARGIVHRRHLGGEEAGLVLEHRRQQLHRNVLGQQGLQDRVLVRLVIVERRWTGVGVLLDFRRDQLLDGGDLRHHRLEAAVDQAHHIELAGGVEIQNMARDRLHQRKARRLQADFIAFDEAVAELAAQLVAALAADGDDLDVLALGDQRRDLLARGARDR